MIQETKKVKRRSKYIEYIDIENIYNSLNFIDKTVFKVLHLTGIRIGEFEIYIEEIINNTDNRKGVDIQPLKKNNKRLIPIVITEIELQALSEISVKKKALMKRIAKGDLGFTPHDLRATFITNALEKDLNPVKVQHLVGHTKLETTLSYARLNTSNNLWMYKYITQDNCKGTDSDDIQELKEMNGKLSAQVEKLKWRLKNVN